MSFASLYSQGPSAVAGIWGKENFKSVYGSKERRNEREGRKKENE